MIDTKYEPSLSHGCPNLMSLQSTFGQALMIQSCSFQGHLDWNDAGSVVEYDEWANDITPRMTATTVCIYSMCLVWTRVTSELGILTVRNKKYLNVTNMYLLFFFCYGRQGKSETT